LCVDASSYSVSWSFSIINIIMYILFIVIVFLHPFYFLLPFFLAFIRTATIKTNRQQRNNVNDPWAHPTMAPQARHPRIDFTWCLPNTMQTIVIFIYEPIDISMMVCNVWKTSDQCYYNRQEKMNSLFLIKKTIIHCM